MDLRVIHILRAPVGGLFRHVFDLAMGQKERGLRVGVVCDSQTGGSFAEAALRSLRPLCELGLHRIPMSRAPGWSDMKVFRELNRILAANRPDVLHGHGAKGAAYARILAPRIGARAIYTPHGGSLHFTQSSIRGWVYLNLERLLRRRTDGAIFESEFARRSYLEKVGPATFPCRVVHNGLYEHEFEGLQRKTANYDFVFAGELRALKGIYVLLDAVVRLKQHCEPSVLLVGAGPEEANVAARIRELGLADNVHMSPPVRPVTEALARGRCAVIPSLAESLPYIVLETVAAGVPLLATRVGGIPEIVGAYADRLVPSRDSRALAEAMLGYLRDPESVEVDAEKIRETVREKFTVSRMVDEVIDFYMSITHMQKRAA